MSPLYEGLLMIGSEMSYFEDTPAATHAEDDAYKMGVLYGEELKAYGHNTTLIEVCLHMSLCCSFISTALSFCVVCLECAYNSAACMLSALLQTILVLW